MTDEPTTAAIQRCLDALHGGTAAEPLLRDLLERAVGRLRLLCASLLHRSYPRLTHPPLNLETDELLAGVVAGLLQALWNIRPQTGRPFFALANQHLRWRLNGLARLLDEQPRTAGWPGRSTTHRDGVAYQLPPHQGEGEDSPARVQVERGPGGRRAG